MVKMESFQYRSQADACILNGDVYQPDQARAMIFLIHGMADYRKRYQEYAKQLAAQGYRVVAMDLRGHGDSPCQGLMGYFGEDNGLGRQLHDFVECIKLQNPEGLPVFIFGHSMGSLWARYILKHYPGLPAGLLLSGSPGKLTGSSTALSIITGLAAGLTLISPTKPAKMIANNLNSHWLKQVDKPLTKIDWLSYDRPNILAYFEDPHCGFPFTFSGYKDLAELFEEVYAPNSWQVNRPQIPILFMSGADDPVAEHPREGLQKAAQDLSDKGYSQVTLKVYAGARHELFFDQYKEQVWQDSFKFFNSIDL